MKMKNLFKEKKKNVQMNLLNLEQMTGNPISVSKTKDYLLVTDIPCILAISNKLYT